VKEFTQIHDMDTYTPMDASKLTREQKTKALSSLLFLTEKRDWRIKARQCAVGSKQRTFEGYNKADGSSPIISTDGLLISAAIDGHENRSVLCLDIPGAFLNADNDEFVLMCLRGEMAEMMVKVDPSIYRKYVVTGRNGVPHLYVKLNKALYGLLKAALLFYKKLVGELKSMGFVLNKYDPCVANRIVNGSQQTVCWHVDDLKVSHVDPEVNESFAKDIMKIYGNKVTINRGDIHDYLGIDFDFSHANETKISMIKYLHKIIETFPEEIGKPVDAPHQDWLFKIRDDPSIQLPEEQAQQFHHTVAQLLFVAMRARPDIQTSVSFLTKRVQKPDEDDWNKLKRVLRYLKGTKHMKLSLRVDNLNTICWWVDAAYGVHMDLKGHTGMMMTLG